jgi:hypothetical protein
MLATRICRITVLIGTPPAVARRLISVTICRGNRV